MDNWLNIIPVGLLLVASMVVIITENWRTALVALAVIYLGSFILLFQVLSFSMAAAKLITGWMCVAILSFITRYQNNQPVTGLLPGRIFQGLALVMIWVVAFILTSKMSVLFQVSPEIAFASFAVLGCGLMQLGMSSIPFKVVHGILIFFAGFELLYAGMESSILINGLILVVDLMIAFVGSFLITQSSSGGNE